MFHGFNVSFQMSRLLLLQVLFVCCTVGTTTADLITVSDFVSVPQQLIGSGNGTLDLRMATFSGSEIDNEAGSFNADNGNKSLPNSGGADTSSFDESYVVTAKEVKDFYILNFPNGIGSSDVADIVVFLDLNETGGGSPSNFFTLLDVVLNPATISGNPNALGDVTGAEQAAINQVHTGGTLSANMAVSSINLPVNNQGAGFADYGIYLGIDPFGLADNDVLLFNFSMNTLSNGAEELFLSGEFSPADLTAAVPEPGSLLMFSAVCLGLTNRRSRS